MSLVALLAGCVGVDEGDPDRALSVRTDGLTVGGYECPTHGEIAGRTQPADHRYYLTTFGGGSDTQSVACGGTADGRWLYIADSWRFHCGARVRVSHPTNRRYCVTQVADVGPNICVEQAAGRAIIDASPLVARHLYGTGSAGWSERLPVLAVEVSSTTPLECGTDEIPLDSGVSSDVPTARDAATSDVARDVTSDVASDVPRDVVAPRDVVTDARTPDASPPDASLPQDAAPSDAARDAASDDAAPDGAPTTDDAGATDVTIESGCTCRAGTSHIPFPGALSLAVCASIAALRRRRR